MSEWIVGLVGLLQVLLPVALPDAFKCLECVGTAETAVASCGYVLFRRALKTGHRVRLPGVMTPEFYLVLAVNLWPLLCGLGGWFPQDVVGTVTNSLMGAAGLTAVGVSQVERSSIRQGAPASMDTEVPESEQGPSAG